VDEETHQPLLSILSLIVETAVKLRNYGHKVVIVSSGAIGVGLRRMDMEKRPQHLPRVQVTRYRQRAPPWGKFAVGEAAES
jgi:glutamate 5-kinase